MSAPKYKSSELEKLFKEGDKNQNLHDKKIVEALIKRLNDQFKKDPKLAKKAALLLESWIKR